MIYNEQNHWEWHHRKMVGVFQEEKAKVARLHMRVTELKQEIEILKEELRSRDDK